MKARDFSLVDQETLQVTNMAQVWASSQSDGGGDQGGDGATGLLSRPEAKTKLKAPSPYRVLLHNDDYTPMDFVVEILRQVFHKDEASAVKIMLDVHRKGVGSCGVYPHDIAETKVSVVRESASRHEYPLLCTMEKEPV